MLVDLLPWKKSGRETLQKASRSIKGRKRTEEDAGKEGGRDNATEARSLHIYT